MHGRRGMAAALARAVGEGRPSGVDVALCVPFPYLDLVGAALADSAVSLGAQDVSGHEDGAYTGEVSAGMLAEFECRYVIVGHSERRAGHGESSVCVAEKAARAIEAGMTPVVCVGETLHERESGRMMDVIASQLGPVLDLGAARLARIVIAYEPVWAIGTGQTASVAQAVEVHGEIRQALRARAADVAEDVRLLYGGSVKPASAPALFAGKDIDGGLIGGAALDASSFLAICQAGVAAG